MRKKERRGRRLFRRRRLDAAPAAEAELTAEESRARSRQQIRYIIEEMGGPEHATWYDEGSGDPADFLYLYRPGHILVRADYVDQVRDQLGDDGGPVDRPRMPGVTLYRLPNGLDVHTALDRLDDSASLPTGVATPDHIVHLTPRTGGCCPQNEPEPVPPGTGPNPPVSSAEEGGGADVLVSVVDTGWYDDPTPGWAPWLDGVTGDAEQIDPANIHQFGGHGTFVAGVVRCMAPEAEVRVEAFPHRSGSVHESRLVEQLVEAMQHTPDIISMSAGTNTRKQRKLLSFEEFWRHELQGSGTVLVAAAGNHGERERFWPAAFPWAVAVGALRADGKRRATFSNYGGWVDVYAVGVDVVNAFPKGSYTYKESRKQGTSVNFHGLAQWSGTSFSTPLVSGLIANRMSVTGEDAPAAADALRALARQNAIPKVGAVLRPGDV